MVSDMIRTKDIMASLPLVASVLGDKYGVNVIIGGDQACTNGKTIMLPTLPLDCDAELLALARAFVDHEASHIRHTNFRALQAANLTSFQKHLWNIIEDLRCKNALTELFPGCRQHFRWLIQYYFGKEDNDKAGDTNPALSVLNYVLLTVKAWDVPAIEKPKRKEAAVIQQTYPGLLPKLDSTLDEVRMDCKSTQDAIGYALKLSVIMEEYLKNSNQNKEEQKPDKGTDARMDSPKPDKPKPMQGEASTNYDFQSGEAFSTDSQAESTRTAAQQQLREMLYAPADDLPQHLGAMIAEALNAQQSVPSQHGLAVAQTGYKYISDLSEEVRTESIKNSVALRARLHGLLQAVTQQPCALGRRGKLCPQRLHGLAAHNPRVFLKRGEKRQTFTAVHLLVDCSGSMSGGRMELASRACYAVALALEQCRGVNVGVTAFPGNDTRMGITVAPILLHGERVHHKFSMTGTGYTPLGEALWWVVQHMCPLKEERKIILILSDGMPDSVPVATHALKQAKILGFEVMGLGIMDNCVTSLLSPLSMPHQTIHNMQELAPTMFGMLQQSLLSNPST